MGADEGTQLSELRELIAQLTTSDGDHQTAIKRIGWRPLSLHLLTRVTPFMPPDLQTGRA